MSVLLIDVKNKSRMMTVVWGGFCRAVRGLFRGSGTLVAGPQLHTPVLRCNKSCRLLPSERPNTFNGGSIMRIEVEWDESTLLAIFFLNLQNSPNMTL